MPRHLAITNKDIRDAQESLLDFTKLMFRFNHGMNFIMNRHHEEICDYLGAVLIGEVRRLIINIPPRYGKTETSVINFIPWCLGNYPDSEFIHACYSAELSSSNSMACKNVVLSDAYQLVFPYTHITEEARARHHWRTTMGGVMYASGIGGTVTGYGAGKMRKRFGGAIVVDDPHKPLEALSEPKRVNVITWFQNTLMSRLNARHTPIVIIMQRLHEADLSGWLLEGGTGEHWENLKIPALLPDGKALWSYKHTVEDLKRMEEKAPYEFAGQYQQTPSPLGGGMFKDKWWRYYKVLPNVKYKIITVDTAQKEGEHNDWSVFQCWGYFEKCIYLIDQIRGKWESPELKTRFEAFWSKHLHSSGAVSGVLRYAYVEDRVSGTSLIQEISRPEIESEDEDGRSTQKPAIPIKPISRNKDKVLRANDAIPYIESGNVFLPKPENAPWLSDYLVEFSRFTPLKTHEFDDQVDCTVDAISETLGAGRGRVGLWPGQLQQLQQLEEPSWVN